MTNDIYMLWLSSMVHQIGSRKLNSLVEIFGSARAVFLSHEEDLENAMGNAVHSYQILKQHRSLEYIEGVLVKLESCGVAYISRNSERFPTLLAQIPDPPLGIFFMGTLPPDAMPKVAIIGSRKCSEYGLLAARLLAKPLAEAGVAIVSGMARGVDSMAHRGALQGGGITIAVLGCGADVCYPAENRELRDEITKRGCVISEYAPGIKPSPAFFPARNRIISGLSIGVIVTEASLKSGTLITVDQAQEQGRDVMAVPGNISSKLSQGTNQLIRDGAYAVSDHKDVLAMLGIRIVDNLEEKQEKLEVNLATDEKLVYDKLSLEPIGVEALAAATKHELGKLHLICTKLELKGLARKLPGARYIRG